ncbi:LysR family transcriptional regulator [Actinomadura fulvescens]|uniref:Hydrogen peroxide-inducible genes activator OxyR n=1 Tax=Actinomadura fulvescens TaxID=46160 RepID=A0ABN3PK22_9ACTN
MKFELRHLRAFVVLAEELHFGRAAERLRIAQPALSQQIQRLEADLGVILLVRDRRGTALSPAGQAFLPEAIRTLEQAAIAETTAWRAHKGECGRLRVGCYAPSSAGPFLETLAGFQLRSPEVELMLQGLRPGSQTAPLLEDRIDIALMTVLGEVRPPGEVTARPLWRDPLVAALPKGHRLAASSQIAPEDLAQESFAVMPRGRCGEWFEEIIALCRRAGFSPRITHQLSEISDQLGLVAAGLRVALVPRPSRSPLPGEVVYVPLAGTRLEVSRCAAWRSDDSSPVVARIREALEVTFPVAFS